MNDFLIYFLAFWGVILSVLVFYVLFLNGIPQRLLREWLKPGGPDQPLLQCAAGHEDKQVTEFFRQCQRCNRVEWETGIPIPHGMKEYADHVIGLKKFRRPDEEAQGHAYAPDLTRQKELDLGYEICRYCGWPRGFHLDHCVKAPGIPPAPVSLSDEVLGFWYTYYSEGRTVTDRAMFSTKSERDEWIFRHSQSKPDLRIIEEIKCRTS